MMHWLLLVIAGLFEVSLAIGLRYSEGFTKPMPSILTIIGMIASFYFLSLALKNLPIGNAYAVWTGIGTVGTMILGVALFNEPIDIIRLSFIGLIVIGIVGLRLVSAH